MLSFNFIVQLIILLGGDIETGGNIQSISALKDVFLNIDFYKVEQVVRNLVTNAVFNA